MTQDEEIREHLLSTNLEFRRLVDEHHSYEAKLQSLVGQSQVTPEQQLEQVNLKKRKLNLKDQMSQMIQHYRHQHAEASQT